MRAFFASISVVLLFVITPNCLQAQDKQFSQFNSAPLMLNPALTGAFSGRYRVTATYRDQWRAALDRPYVTFATGLDLRLPVSKRGMLRYDHFGLGIQFFTDKIPGIEFVSNQIAVSAAYHKVIDKRRNQYLSLGFQGGINQRSFNYENVYFSDQFNGIDLYDQLSGENLPANNVAFADYAWGLNYTFSPNENFAVFAGAAMHHFLRPNVSFYGVDADDEPIDVLNPRYALFASIQMPVSRGIQFHPRAMAALQGGHLLTNAGGNFRFLLNQYSGTAVHIGGWARSVRSAEGNVFLDAIVGMFGIEVNHVLFGFSYDINLADIRSTMPVGRNAFEFSIAFLGNYDNEVILCPKF